MKELNKYDKRLLSRSPRYIIDGMSIDFDSNEFIFDLEKLNYTIDILNYDKFIDFKSYRLFNKIPYNDDLNTINDLELKNNDIDNYLKNFVDNNLNINFDTILLVETPNPMHNLIFNRLIKYLKSDKIISHRLGYLYSEDLADEYIDNKSIITDFKDHKIIIDNLFRTIYNDLNNLSYFTYKTIDEKYRKYIRKSLPESYEFKYENILNDLDGKNVLILSDSTKCDDYNTKVLIDVFDIKNITEIKLF